jgi:hypothetical protein
MEARGSCEAVSDGQQTKDTVSVKDSGKNVPMENVARVFQIHLTRSVLHQESPDTFSDSHLTDNSRAETMPTVSPKARHPLDNFYQGREDTLKADRRFGLRRGSRTSFALMRNMSLLDRGEKHTWT